MSDDQPDEFTARRLQKCAEQSEQVESTLCGDWQCAACNHKWTGVVPAGVVMAECPSCHRHFGHPMASVLREGYFWKCHCGNDLFRIHPTDGVYCIMCGTTQGAFEQ